MQAQAGEYPRRSSEQATQRLTEFIKRPLAILLLTGLSGAACASRSSDEAADPLIAAAVAQHLDLLNGSPSVVVNGFWCDLRVEDCVPGPDGPSLTPLDATEFAGAFASAREIPLAPPLGFCSPTCPWAGNEAGGEGLYAMFVSPPSVDADSASVELSTGCNASEVAFEQVHRFVLRQARNRWVVVRRELISIT
jgi:hypothetical protein